MLLHDFAGEPVFIVWFKKDGMDCFRTYPHDVEAATVHIEYLKMLKGKRNV